MLDVLFVFPPLPIPGSPASQLDDWNIDPQLRLPSGSSSSASSPSVTPPSVTPSRELSTGDKRPAEDLCQYATTAGRWVRLKVDNQQEVDQFARLTAPQRQVWTAIHILKLQEHLQAIQPAKALWSISNTLVAKIEQYTFAVLISPALMFYVKEASPVKMVIGILEKHPAWGYTKDVRNDKYKADMVKDRAQVRLTDRRSNIKDLIMLSFGPEDWVPSIKESASKRTTPIRLNIVQLCTTVAKKHPTSPPTVSLQMCARFAFLRNVLRQLFTNPKLASISHRDYWSLVDDQLVLLRKHPEPGGVTRALTKLLEDDRNLYGHPDDQDEPKESGAVQNNDQRIADHAATGTFVEDEED